MATIQKIETREVLDSRGFPTVEVDVTVDHSFIGRAIAPSGASTGEGEALELRDGDARRYLGKGVLTAIQNIQQKIIPALVGRDFPLQSLLDDALCDLDGTPNKSRLGANAILPISMAFARAQAASEGITTDQLIARIYGSSGGISGESSKLSSRSGSSSPSGTLLPVPLMNILNGGKHADNGLNIQEFMIVPAGFDRFSDALRAGVEIFHRLKKILHSKGLVTSVGDEGGFAPTFEGQHPHEQALSCIMQAISEAGYQADKQIFLALDCAASEFYSKNSTYLFEGNPLSSDEMVQVYQKWVQEFPIISIEDGLSEHDWEGWGKLTRTLGHNCQLVGDDLFVTNPAYLKKGIELKAANAILIKLNQIGTVTETLETMKLAQLANFNSIASHRSGETEDTFITDLALGTECGQIKTGSACRTDRVAKYNELLRKEEKLGKEARFAGLHVFEKFRQGLGLE